MYDITKKLTYELKCTHKRKRISHRYIVFISSIKRLVYESGSFDLYKPLEFVHFRLALRLVSLASNKIVVLA